MMNNLALLGQAITQSINYVDVTEEFRTQQLKNSIWTYFCDYKTCTSLDDWKIQKDPYYSAIVLNPGNPVMVSASLKEVYTPPVQIAAYPTEKFSTVIHEGFQIQHLMDRAVSGIVSQENMEFLRMLTKLADVLAEKHTITTINTAIKEILYPATLIMGRDSYKQIMSKEPVETECPTTYPEAWVTPDHGPVAKRYVEHYVADGQSKPLMSCTYLGHTVLVTDDAPRKSVFIIRDNKEAFGSVCLSEKVFAYPISDPQRLKAGFILSSEIGMAIEQRFNTTMLNYIQ